MATLEVTAFEYKRKFNKTLNPGDCCQREIAVNMGNNSYYIETQQCTLVKKGTVCYNPQEISESKNILISSTDMFVTHLGLCGGEAASFLGILNSGDCVSVEIASRLTFSEKTVIRAFVGIFQKSLDSIEGVSNTVDGMEMYYRDKFYLKDRTYGTYEMILVQLRFKSIMAAKNATKIKNATPLMSEYMEQMYNVEPPRSILVISLSTATQEEFKVKQFQKEDWDRALRWVQILELSIQRTKNQINTNTKHYHLMYRLQPFLEEIDYRLTAPKYWEDISMLEIQLRQILRIAKSTAKKCRGDKTQTCHRVRQMKKKMITAHAEVHKGRTDWIKIKPEERQSLATVYSGNVDSYSSIIKTLAKSVKQMKNKETKVKKENKKSNSFNQIPRKKEESIQKRQRQMRQGNSKKKNRNEQAS